MTQPLCPNPNDLRVFISSTFLDMQPEREYLVKQVFPELRQICRERGITFTEIDLRWGITERQARRRKIVSTCLDEIHRHRPFIIGLIGERCGWQPGPKDLGTDASVLQRYPWLGDAVQQEQSLVELETVESAAHNKSLRDRTRFYFRSSSGGEDGVPQLRDRIRSSGLSVREPYGDVETLGAWVREDLLAEIERMQPSSRNFSFVEQERRGHEAFAASRRRVYVEHAPTLRKLDLHAAIPDLESSSPPASSFILPPSSLPLVVTGDSGSGKSSLLSYWSHRYRHDHPDAIIVTHHVGATATSTNHLGLLRHVMLEIQDRYGITTEVPTAPEKIESEFRNWLGYASRGGMVLVIDALNQLSESSRRSLKWLPDYFPPYVRVIVSTLDGEVFEQLKQWNWLVLKVKPLTKAEREQVVRGYFKSFGKELDAKNVRRLVADSKSISPLYLVTTLEELRVFGSYEEISSKIGHYLEASDLDDLFQRVLARLEGDYGKKLVREVMSSLWASRNGLSEIEIMDLTGCNRLDLRRLLNALEFHLLLRDNVLGFFHEYLRRGVERRYVCRLREKRKRYEIIATYFDGVEPTLRTSRELLHALEALGDQQRLSRTLAQIPRLELMWPGEGRNEVLHSWSGCQPVEIVVATKMGLEDWVQQSEPTASRRAVVLDYVAEMFDAVGRWSDAEAICLDRLEILRVVGDASGESAMLASLSGLLHRQGRIDEAESLVLAAEEIARKLGDLRRIASALGQRGVAHSNRGEYDAALECYDEQERLARELEDHRSIALVAGNRSTIHWYRGEYDAALVCCDEQERISRELCDRPNIANAVANRASIHFARGEYPQALACLEEQERIAREIGNRESIAIAIGNRGAVLLEIGEYDDALNCFDERERIARELGDRKGTAVSVGNRAVVYELRTMHEMSLACYAEAAAINRQIGNRHGLADNLLGSARTLIECFSPETKPWGLESENGQEVGEDWPVLSLRRARAHAIECTQISREIGKLDTLLEAEVQLARIDVLERV